MDDELAYPRRECSSHTGYWYGEYWCCQEEGCRYRDWLVPMQVPNHQENDVMGYNGDDLNNGPVVDEQNQWADATFRYGGTPAYGELQDGYQPSSQQGYGAHQYGHYQQNEVYQNADQQNGHHSNNQYDGQHSGHQNGYQQTSQEDNVGWSNAQNGWSQWDVRRSSPPSPVSATMGSAPSTAQANSPTSTGTFDNEAASTAGNADEDRMGPYVAEQPTVGMDERDDEDTANQAMERIESCFPEYRNRDTRRQYQPSYSSELSFSDGSESDVTQPNVE